MLYKLKLWWISEFLHSIGLKSDAEVIEFLLSEGDANDAQGADDG